MRSPEQRPGRPADRLFLADQGEQLLQPRKRWVGLGDKPRIRDGQERTRPIGQTGSHEAAPGLQGAARVFPGDDHRSLRELRGMLRVLLADTPHVLRLDEIILCAHEMAANAVRHTVSGEAGGSYLVTVAWDQVLVRVAVTDQGGSAVPTLPGPGAGGLWAEGGRGLLLVAASAQRWGSERTGFGLQVWCEIGLRGSAA